MPRHVSSSVTWPEAVLDVRGQVHRARENNEREGQNLSDMRDIVNIEGIDQEEISGVCRAEATQTIQFGTFLKRNKIIANREKRT